MVVALLSVVAGVGGWAASGFFLGGPAPEVAPPATGTLADSGLAGGDVALLRLEDMVLNIRGYTLAGQSLDRHMKISLTLVYDAAYDAAAPVPADAAAPSGMAAQAPYLRDIFLGYLRQLTERDLDGSAGLATLKAELLKRARAATGGTAPREILVSDLVIQ